MNKGDITPYFGVEEHNFHSVFAQFCTKTSLGPPQNLLGSPEKLGRIAPPHPPVISGDLKIGGGILAFKRGGGGRNTLLDPRKCTFNLGVWGGGGIRRARKLKNTLQIITRWFNDPLQSVEQNQKWTISGPSGYMPAFFVFSKIGEKKIAVSCVQKNRQDLYFFFCGKSCTKNITQITTYTSPSNPCWDKG